MASPEIRELHELLEVQFHPMQVSKKIRPIMEKLQSNPEYAKYARPLYRVVLTRLLQHLSQMYSAIKFDTLLKIVDFAGPCQMSRFDVERFILEGCRRGEFSVRVNHQTDSLHFDVSLFGTSQPSVFAGSQVATDSSLRTQLTVLASGLYNSLQMIDGPAVQEERKAKKHEEFAKILEEMKKEYQWMTERKKRIERKKQLLQKTQIEREIEEAKERASRAQQEA
jgi:translation initiation factor 3 subunit A